MTQISKQKPAKPKKGVVNLVCRWDHASNDWALDEAGEPFEPGAVEVYGPKDNSPFLCVIALDADPSITFDVDDPISTSEKGCPAARTGLESKELTVISCDPRLLTIHDKNNGKDLTIFYTIQFKGAEAYDPIIINGRF